MSKPPRSRGRRALAWAAGVFAVVQLAASVLFDYGWPQVRYPVFYQQVGRLDAFAEPPAIVFFGSSRTGSAVKEPEIDAVLADLTGERRARCFNAYFGYGDLIVADRALDDLLRRGARPRFAVIEVCPELLNHRNAWLTYYAQWFLGWSDVPAYLRELAVTNNLARFAGTRAIPLYVFRYQIRRQLAAVATGEAPVPAFASDPPLDPPPHRSAAGWRRLVADGLRDARAAAPARVSPDDLDEVRRGLRDYRPGGNAAAALERLLRRCRANAIEPILLAPPLSTPHRRCYTPAIEAAFRGHVTTAAAAYGCRFLDWRAALPDALFIDHHHSSAAGGAFFSRMLAVEVLAPAWRGE